MAGPIILEYGNRATRQPSIRKFNQDSISIGRGYDNDLIMPNRYIAPEQFRIESEQGYWLLHILDNTNLVKINGRTTAAQKTKLYAGDRVQIGNMEFRLHDYNVPPSPTRSLGWTSRLESHVMPLMAVGMLLLLAMESFFSQSVYQLGEVKWQPIFNETLWVLGFAIVWAGAFSLLGRLLKHEAHYAVQLMFTALTLFTLAVGDNLAAYLSFYSLSDTIFFIWNWICEPIIISLLIYVHFKFATMLARPLLWAMVITFSLCAVLYSVETGNHDEFSHTLNQDPFIRAPFLPVFNSIETSEFISGHQQLLDEIEEEIAEEMEEEMLKTGAVNNPGS